MGKGKGPRVGKGNSLLEQIDGVIKTAEAITIQPGETKKINGIAPFKGNSKRINVFTEPLEKMVLEEDPAWMIVPSYSECKNGSSRVGVTVKNVSQKVVVIAKGQQIAQVSAANQVPNILAPKYVITESEEGKKNTMDRSFPTKSWRDPERITKLWEQLDITGLDSCKVYLSVAYT